MTQQVDQETGEIYTEGGHWEPEISGTTNTGGLTTPDDLLIEYFRVAKDEIEAATIRAGHLEQELQRRAAERGATVIHGNGMDYKIETKKEYDRTQLPPLVELLTPTQVGKCVVPAHLKPVPEAYDMQQWNKAGRENGGELQEGLDALTFAGKASGKLVQTEE